MSDAVNGVNATMPVVRLSGEDWQRVLQVLATAPWQAVNPLIMSIGGQLAAQAPNRMPVDGQTEGEPASTTRQ